MFITHMKYILDKCELYENEWWINKIMKKMFCKRMHIKDIEE
jgi:hypothetical protein